ncbi:MAG TPA: DoxX family protein, partial [Verrucomicrobiae bacterium]|nr:DoxX family protein [Verrucomicrobiae bacterium]
MQLERCYGWIRSHREFFVDLIRIYLGIGLFIKGIFFFMHPEALAAPVQGSWMAPLALAVPWVHVLGGLLLASGIFARLAALVQIPIVLAALMSVNLPRMSGMQAREAVEFSALTLFILVLLAIWGAGPLSVPFARRATASRAHSTGGWLHSHADLFLDLIRMYLGLGLFIKGFYIMAHQEEFQQVAASSGIMPLKLLAVAHYVIPVHFVGGLMLLLGMATRLGAIMQIPLLIGAVCYVYLPRFGTLELRQNLEFSTLVLFLLCIFAIAGSGRYSIESA